MDDENLPKTSLFDFERPRLDHILYQENNKPHGFGMDPNDGLPKPVVMSSITDTEAAKLDPEKFVCMEHEREVKGFFFKKKEVRPQCEHYRRQLLPSPHDPERTVCIRYCTALKDENGEMFSVNDQEVLACELRSPADNLSQLRLNKFDDKIIEAQKEREAEEEVFDPMAALEEEQE